jgi:hypothetical protein
MATKAKIWGRYHKTLDDLKESENGVFQGYGENHNWTHINPA